MNSLFENVSIITIVNQIILLVIIIFYTIYSKKINDINLYIFKLNEKKSRLEMFKIIFKVDLFLQQNNHSVIGLIRLSTDQREKYHSQIKDDLDKFHEFGRELKKRENELSNSFWKDF